MPLVGRGQAIQDLAALLHEMRKPALHGLQMFLRLLPLLERQTQAVQLRLELGQTLFQVGGSLLIHCGAEAWMIHNNTGVSQPAHAHRQWNGSMRPLRARCVREEGGRAPHRRSPSLHIESD